VAHGRKYPTVGRKDATLPVGKVRGGKMKGDLPFGGGTLITDTATGSEWKAERKA